MSPVGNPGEFVFETPEGTPDSFFCEIAQGMVKIDPGSIGCPKLCENKKFMTVLKKLVTKGKFQYFPEDFKQTTDRFLRLKQNKKEIDGIEYLVAGEFIAEKKLDGVEEFTAEEKLDGAGDLTSEEKLDGCAVVLLPGKILSLVRFKNDQMQGKSLSIFHNGSVVEKTYEEGNFKAQRFLLTVQKPRF